MLELFKSVNIHTVQSANLPLLTEKGARTKAREKLKALTVNAPCLHPRLFRMLLMTKINLWHALFSLHLRLPHVALVGTVGPYGPIACCVAWSQELCWCIRARHGELGTCRSRVPWGCAVPCRAGSVGCSCLLPAATGGCWKGRELRAQIERAMGLKNRIK